jgi:tetratricopeptide (TPR) repeat protein
MMPRARAAALKALEIDEELGEAHATLALVRAMFDFDRAEAETGFRRALELKPGDALAHLWYGLHLTGTGRFDQGLAEIALAQKLDPKSPGMNAYMGASLYLARRYGELIDRMRPVADMHPNYHHPHAWLALAYEQTGDWAKAIAHMETAHSVYGESESLAQLGHIYAMAGRSSEARAVLRKLRDMSRTKYVSAYNVALVHAGLNERDDAFRELSRAREDRGEWFAFAGVDPRLDPLRTDPRFRDLLRSIGLPDSPAQP